MSNEILEELTTLADKISKDKPRITDEAKTRTAFVNPFLKILGYKLDDTRMIMPEYDVGYNKDKKVDYAILYKDKPLVLLEIKHHSENLSRHINQLKNYYKLADCKFGILTNGLEYRFFADTQTTNTMDSEPFMVINLESKIDSESLEILEYFKCGNLQSKIKAIQGKAKVMLEKATTKALLEKEIKNPSKEFVAFVNKKLKGTKIKESNITTAFNEIIADKANEIIVTKEAQNAQSQDSQDTSKELSEEENQAFYIVRGILLENPKANLNNIIITPATNYVAIRLSDSRLKWICRLYLKKHINRNGYLAIPDKSDSTKESQPLYVDSLADIYKYKNELAESLKMRLR